MLAFLVVAWVYLATTLALSQPVREANLRALPGTGTADVMVLLGGIAGFLTVLVIGVVQGGLALAMLVGYRRARPWGAF